jgi:hypothetical protein
VWRASAVQLCRSIADMQRPGTVVRCRAVARPARNQHRCGGSVAHDYVIVRGETAGCVLAARLNAGRGGANAPPRCGGARTRSWPRSSRRSENRRSTTVWSSTVILTGEGRYWATWATLRAFPTRTRPRSRTGALASAGPRSSVARTCRRWPLTDVQRPGPSDTERESINEDLCGSDHSGRTRFGANRDLFAVVGTQSSSRLCRATPRRSPTDAARSSGLVVEQPGCDGGVQARVHLGLVHRLRMEALHILRCRASGRRS